MAAPVTETQKDHGMSSDSGSSPAPKPMLCSYAPSGSILTADLLPLVDKSTPTKRQLHAPLYYLATLSVFLILYSLIAAEVFIVIGRWRKPFYPSGGVCLQLDLKTPAYATDCSLIQRVPLM